MNPPTYPSTAPTAPAGAPAGPATPASAVTHAAPATPAAPTAPAAPAAPPPVAAKQPTSEKPPVVVGAPLKSGKRRARLVVRRLDPWSVLKFSLLFSLCLLVVFVVAVGALYFALDSLGVFDSLNEALAELTSTDGEDGTGGVQVVFSASTVLTGAAVVGAINVVILTAICTLAAFLYNLCSDVVGGIEVTLAERE